MAKILVLKIYLRTLQWLRLLSILSRLVDVVHSLCVAFAIDCLGDVFPFCDDFCCVFSSLAINLLLN